MSLQLSSYLLLFVVGASIASAVEPPLTVAAASDLSVVGPKLQALYSEQHPEGGVRLVFSASAMLKQQIEAAAPFDIFLSANASYVDQLAATGKIDAASVITYAQGQLGIFWRDGRKHPLHDLTTAPVRFIALPNPKLAPYGVAAQQALEHGGLWQKVQAKIVYAENVRQALQMVESGNADVVLTSDSLLQGKNADLIPSAWHQPIIQKAGVVAASPQRQAAGNFLKFLQSPPAQALFAHYGFTAPPRKGIPE